MRLTSLSMFDDSTEVNISGRNPILNHASRDIIMYQGSVLKRSPNFELLMENVAIGALHSSREVSDAPKCRSGTRVAILDAVFHWATASVYTICIQWIYGAASSGKSTLLRTLAERLGQHRLLLASFFFSRTADRRNSADHFISTIAYQIARSIPSTRTYIERAIENDPLIFSQSPDAQAEALIVLPITQAYQEGVIGEEYPRIIIVDGIDECKGKRKQQQVLRVLNKVLMVPVPLAFLIASRPRTHILATFDSDLSESCTRLALESFDEDDKKGRFTPEKPDSRIPRFSSAITIFSNTITTISSTITIFSKSLRRLRVSPGNADFTTATKALSNPGAPADRMCLMRAITSFTKAIDAWGPSHRNYPTAHVNRALAQLWLYELNGKPDADMLQRVISDSHTALDTWQKANTRPAAYFQACCSLGTAYRLRQSISKALKDGLNAIKYHEKALAVSGDSRVIVLIELGTSRWRFSERARTDEELNDAIKNLEEALGLLEVDDDSHARCLQSLAGAYNVRYTLTKDSNDLKSAITFYRHALKSPQLKPADKAAAFLQLSRSLAFQKEHGHLKVAISEVEHCLDLIGSNNTQHPLYADAQDHLGGLYWSLYRNTSTEEQDMNDLHLAIEAYEAALRSRRSPETLFNIAAVHFVHFQNASDKEYLLAAKRYAAEARKSCSAKEVSVKIQELLDDLTEASQGRRLMRPPSYQSLASTVE